MKLNVTPWHFDELMKKGYSLDIVYLLNLVKDKVDVENMGEFKSKGTKIL